MMEIYPIMLRLKGKRIVVVGGGKVAERKVAGLLGTGARIILICPEASDGLKQLALDGKIDWRQKSFSESDLQDAFMIFAATNDTELNRLVKNSAADHQLATIADDPNGSDFHVPSHLKRGRLSIAVSTGGASPTLARKIRQQLELQFDDSYESYLEFLFETRKWILNEVEDAAIKRNLLKAIVSPEFLNSKNRDEDFQRLYEELK
ncbi:precorrin-2 dehydrogenase/sirohydrochlorin ferrochelatase family protein [Neobacillus ginsengisoli]|uniref:precorrin-2 dehydrogenase n=1 Tax=Neobacillus ginsengisoli TaxID=904295 RepID=A0ABT9Y1V1_9BACI|nr:NAD(P)-dependent oxidoreductase [Neobacillus ginsengisoli]MDQ0201613.1 precorrin-2 dehydrogenase/sirohydrochlorin ferrochelatase [Neobacillus ginsengisoli]